MTPTARSMKHLREAGFIVERVEQTIPIPGMFLKRDCFNVGDLLAANPEIGIVLVQVTTTAHLADREKKCRSFLKSRRVKKKWAHGVLRVWLESGGRFYLHGWAKRGPRGKRKEWQLLEKEILLKT